MSVVKIWRLISFQKNIGHYHGISENTKMQNSGVQLLIILMPPVIIVDKSGEDELKKRLKGDYKKERFVLRPGIWLVVYVQQGLYEAVYGKETISKPTTQIIPKVTRDELEQGLRGGILLQCRLRRGAFFI